MKKYAIALVILIYVVIMSGAIFIHLTDTKLPIPHKLTYAECVSSYVGWDTSTVDWKTELQKSNEQIWEDYHINANVIEDCKSEPR